VSVPVEVVDHVGMGCVRGPVAELATALLEAEHCIGGVVIAFFDEAAMTSLNGRYRGRGEATDVLSFRDADGEDWSDAGLDGGEPAFDLGELAVCPAVVRRYAAEDDGDTRRQLAWTIIHGLLHLVGYDHETDDGEMRRREQELLEELRPLAEALPVLEGGLL
jgi:probable rRNA maturation factor